MPLSVLSIRLWLVIIASASLLFGCSESGTTQPSGFTRYIGEPYGGGIVFNVWRDASGAEHGLIVSKSNQSDSSEWSNIHDTKVGAGAQSAFDGKGNTGAIIRQQGHASSAALLCSEYSSGGFRDWYLPTQQELGVLWVNVVAVNATLNLIDGAQPIEAVGYWSSNEDPTPGVNLVGKTYFGSGQATGEPKSKKYSVRAVRKF